MRRTRRFFLLAVVVVAGAVAAKYYLQREQQIAAAPAAPKALPLNTQAAGKDWVYAHTVDNRPVVEIRARDMRQVQNPDQTRLDHVELKLFHKQGKEYDLVKSAAAVFDQASGALTSPGEVEIKLAVPAEGPPRERLLSILSSGVRFEQETGKATTDQPASFRFDRGDGKAVGADYDPNTRELHLRSQVELRWGINGPPDRVMLIDAGDLFYREQESKVYLTAGARLRRGTMTLEASDAVITLEDGEIRQVEARQARGADKQPTRQVDYAADELQMLFGPKGAVEKITGEKKARLDAVSDSGRTTMSGHRLDLEMDAAGGDSLLRRALASGSSLLESKPAARTGVQTPATRVLRSEVIELFMRAGGEEVDRIETHTPGTIEFLPNHPSQRRRQLEGERMWIHYAAGNRLQSFRSVNSRTRTDNEPKKGQKTAPPSITSSRNLTAEFDPTTNEMTKLEQWDEFRFEEGDRRATAERATLDAKSNIITLDVKARMSDAAGSVTADRILMDQKTSDFTAEGNVTSIRAPERQRASTSVLSQDEPLQARSRRMVSRDNNRQVIYEGDAMLWQSSNRLRAGRIEIDRAAQVLKAHQQVVSQFVDQKKPKPGAAAKSAPAFVEVKADEMTYSDKDRLAHYQGGAVLNRAGLEVRSREIRAFLKAQEKESSDSSLDRAIADGAVTILQSDAERSRRGASEHAEYYAGEEKVILSGGHPQLIDSKKGTSRGRQLTWFANNDRLLVEGAPAQPVVSRITRP